MVCVPASACLLEHPGEQVFGAIVEGAHLEPLNCCGVWFPGLLPALSLLPIGALGEPAWLEWQAPGCCLLRALTFEGIWGNEPGEGQSRSLISLRYLFAFQMDENEQLPGSNTRGR